MTTPRWYMVDKMGMATLCTSKADAQQEAADAQRFWPHMGPHRAVQLVDAADVEAMRAMRAAQPEVNIHCRSTQKRLATQWGFVPAGAMLGEQAELRRLSDCCPELNLSNYGPDDVDELNGWAIEVSQCIDRALAAVDAQENGGLAGSTPASADESGTQGPASHHFDELLDALSQHDDPCEDLVDALKRVRALRSEVERLARAESAFVDEMSDSADRAMRAAQPAGAANTRAQENVALLAEILNRRPAMNAGLTQAYAAWTAEVYDLMGAIAAEPANEDRAQAAPESFLEIPDVQDESGINSHYSRELVLECINAALASHGQAPAQAIPAAAAGCTRSHPHENMDSACRAKAAIAEMQNMAARGAEATTHDLERFVAMLAAAPTTQAAPQQEAASVDLKTMELAESVGLIGPASRTNDLHAAIQRFHDLICANATIKAAQMAAEAISEAAPQQEAQKPFAWHVTGCGRLLDEDEAKAEARHIGGTARAMPLYTAPQADSVLEDAMRYRWLREHRSIDLHANPSVPWVVRCEFQPIPTTTAIVGEALDAAIDVARKQGENRD